MNIAGFYNESISNGKGIRAVLFVSGCPHRCKGCHNPQTWDGENGSPFDMEEYIKAIKDNPLLDGVTLSGGEPFLYPGELIPFIKRIKALGLNVWSFSGFTYEELIKDKERAPMLRLVDVLIDGLYNESLKDKSPSYKGSFNQRIIDVGTSISSGKIAIMG